MIDPETYIELTNAMLFAIVKQDLTISQAAMVMYACAQPDSEESHIDITRRVRDGLTDWNHESKGRIIAVEAVRIKFTCVNIHKGCKRGSHHVMMARICGSNMWRPEDVSSKHDFDAVILEAVTEQHPTGDEERFVVSRGQSLGSTFADMFKQQPESIDDKVKDFRAELDALFPSNPQQGKEEDHESS